MDVRKVIDGSALFRELDDPERAALARAAAGRRLRAGAYLWRVGDREDGLHILAEGFLQIGVTGVDGEELVLHVVAPGDSLGEPGIYAPEGDRRTHARAVGPAGLVSLPGRAIRETIERHPAAMRAFLRRLSELARGHARRIALTAFHDGRGRLARLLLDLSASHGQVTPRGIRIAVPMSQRTLAGLVSLRRESVNRFMAGYEREGVLAVDDGVVTVFRPQALRAALGLDSLR